MNVLLIPIFAYLFLAIANIFDKFLLSNRIDKPIFYVIIIAFLNVLAFLLIPFGVTWPSVAIFYSSIASGAFFIIALLLIMTALQHNEASRVTTIIGGLQPVFIFMLAFFLLSERLSGIQMAAFILLILGTIIMTLSSSKKRKMMKGLFMIIIGAFFIALSFTISKYVFGEIGFISGMFWTRMGTLLTGFVLLYFAKERKKFFKDLRASKGRASTPIVLFAGQLIGGFGFFLQNYAISVLSVSLVGAMQGLQFMFVFLFTLILSYKFPKILTEELTRKIIYLKSMAILLIAMGVYLLFF